MLRAMKSAPRPAPVPPLGEPSRRWLCHLARASLQGALAARDARAAELPTRPVPRPDDPRLDAPSRLFVSWHDGEELVGCIGTLEPHPSLESGVARYAVIAGVDDPRTPGADPGRWDHLTCEISILGEPVPLAEVGIDAIAPLLRPGRDGVILGVGGRRAFFLPVVWEHFADPRDFLVALCRKAGLDPRRDGPHVRAEVLEAEAFSEPVTPGVGEA